MNSVDCADQLREVYKFDRWIRQQKLWWSIFLWFLGVAIVNAYEIYKKKCEETKKKPMSHYEFQKLVALAWISPSTHGPPPRTPVRNPTQQIVTRASDTASSKRKKQQYITCNSFDAPGHMQLVFNRRHWPKDTENHNRCKLCRLSGRD